MAAFPPPKPSNSGNAFGSIAFMTAAGLMLVVAVVLLFVVRHLWIGLEFLFGSLVLFSLGLALFFEEKRRMTPLTDA